MKLYVKLALSFGGNSPTDGRFRNIQHILNKVNESSAVIASQCMPSIVDIEEVNTLMSDFRVAEI